MTTIDEKKEVAELRKNIADSDREIRKLQAHRQNMVARLNRINRQEILDKFFTYENERSAG
jgi:hypothetical protein